MVMDADSRRRGYGSYGLTKFAVRSGGCKRQRSFGARCGVSRVDEVLR